MHAASPSATTGGGAGAVSASSCIAHDDVGELLADGRMASDRDDRLHLGVGDVVANLPRWGGWA